jgi:serine/threonine protein kinase
VSIWKKTDATPTQVGPYRIVDKIGRGGCGLVLGAVDPEGRSFALKTVLEGVAPERFHRECRLLDRLHHPHIVSVFGTVVDAEKTYLVMERVLGTSLERLLGRKYPFRPLHVVRIAIALADALAYAHDLGIVHRDVTPGNVLITDRFRPMLLDFGIARAEGDTQLTRQGDILGTPGFLAPEVMSGQLPRAAADQFGLGRTLFELCCDPSRPRETPNGLLAMLNASGRIDWTRLRDGGDWSRLRPILERMMALEPEARFASLHEVREAWLTMDSARPISQGPLPTAAAAPGPRWAPPGGGKKPEAADDAAA